MSENLELVISLPSAEDLIAEPKLFLAMAQNMVIESDEQQKLAADDLKSIKTIAKRLDEERKAITKPLDDQKKAVMERYKPAMDFLDKAETILKKAIGGWMAEQERKLAIERAKAQAAAEAERKRIAEEAAAAQKKAHELMAAGNEEAAFEASMSAAELLVTSDLVTASAITEPEKVSGISGRVTWTAEVTDIVQLCAYVAQNPHEAHLVEANLTELRKRAVAMRDLLNIPGVKAVSKSSIAVR